MPKSSRFGSVTETKDDVVSNLTDALETSRARYIEAARIAKLGHWTLDIVSDKLEWSDEVYRIFSIDPGAFVPTYEGFLNSIHPADRAAVDKAYSDSLQKKIPYEIEHRLLTPQGDVKWVLEQCETSFAEDGTPLYSIGTVFDITERKQLEEEIRKGNEKLEERVEERTRELKATQDELARATRIARLGHWRCDEVTGEYISVSEEYARIFGYTFEEFMNRFGGPEKDRELKHPDDKERIERAYALQQDVELNYRILHKNGEVRYIHETCKYYPDETGGIIESMGTIQDVTEQKEAELKLKESEERIRSILDNAVDGIITIDEQGNIKSFNLASENLFGYAADEVIGQNIKMLMPEPYQSEHDLYLDNYRRTGERNVIGMGREVSAQRKDGSVFPISLAVSEINFGGRREFTGIVGDISVRKEAQRHLKQSRRDFARAAKVANLCHWRADPSMTLWFECSENGSQVFDMSMDEILGSYENFVARIHPEDRERVCAFYTDAAGKQQAYQIEYRVIGDDGLTRYLWEIVEPEYETSGKLIGYRGMTQNITELKVAEHEAVQARAAAEQANLAKSQFLANMSHELRTPLNAILGLSQLFEYKQDLPTEHRRNAREIHKAGEHLLSLINELLDLAKIEAGHLELTQEPVKISTILNECQTYVEPLAATRDIIVGMESSRHSNSYIYADYTRLKQVLLNLLSNAVKYNREGGFIGVICSKPDDAEVIRISIRDSGNGIAESDLDKLFKPFERLRAGSGNIEGTGIGLVITRELVELMGGRIGVESVVGEGSTFWVEFGMVEPTKLTEAKGDAVQSDDAATMLPLRAGGRVLVAEDNQANQVVLQQQMELLGVAADFVNDGAEALERLAAGDYALLLTDISMPRMDGYELTDRIREGEQKNGYRLPIVALTAHAMQEQKLLTLEQGMDGFLSKPVTLDSLRAELDRWLGEQEPMAKVPDPESDSGVATETADNGLDLDTLRKMLGNNRERHYQFLNKFLTAAPPIVEAIRVAHAKRDAEEIYQQAHKLKSSARYMGAHALADTCQALDTAGAHSCWEEIDSLVPRLDEQLADVTVFIGDYCGTD